MSEQTFIQCKEAASLIGDADTSICILDVREPGEYRRDHIPGSKNYPLSTLEQNIKNLPEASRLIVCCESGNRAKQACEKLEALGISHSEVLSGGMQSWRSEHLPVNEDQSGPISLQRQVQIAAGSLVAIGTLLGIAVSEWFLIVPGFVGCGLVFAGLTNTCGMALILAQLPYNRRGASC